MNAITDIGGLSRDSGFPAWRRPGLRYGSTPIRKEKRRYISALDYFLGRTAECFSVSKKDKISRRQQALLQTRIHQLSTLPVSECILNFNAVRVKLEAQTHSMALLIDALAHSCLVAERILNLTPHEGQRKAATGLILGQFVEMPTGEGKTLAIALAAAVIGMSNSPVHVLTSNDYLAERDANLLDVFYQALGLSVSSVLPTLDDSARRTAYQSNVVYLTAKQAGFDWMKDALLTGPDSSHLLNRIQPLLNSRRMAASHLLQRGLCTAILDEADSLLLDEARTPLILACPLTQVAATEQEGTVALSFAGMLEAQVHFQLDLHGRQAVLMDKGKEKLEELAEHIPGLWRSCRYRDEKVRLALTALHLYRRDRDYIVQDKKLSLIDELTGRTLPDRRLQHGLHALVELKERCQPTVESEAVASMAFQSFFLRYSHLMGTSATLSEDKAELARIYHASILTVGPQNPSLLKISPAGVYLSRASQFDALIEEVRGALALKRPVLIGTRSVEQSRGVSALLRAHGIEHDVLDAMHDHDEATIIARAGRAGYVTVATNMAGRGTDIPLGDGVAECGGLHLVSLAFNDSRRIDRQLIGRTARQGQPGSFRQLSTLDDSEIKEVMPGFAYAIAKRLLKSRIPARFSTSIVKGLLRFAQLKVEWRHSLERRQSYAASEKLARSVALDGNTEHPL